MRHCSAWLARGRFEDGGLLVPARPSWFATDVILRPDDVVLRARRAAASLSWDDHLFAGGPLEPTGDGWRLSHVATSRYGVRIGIGIELGVSEMGKATAAVPGWSPRLLLRVHWPSGLVAVPLCVWGREGSHLAGDRTALQVLFTVLAARPAARARLRDPDRVARLVADLRARDHGVVRRRTGGRRSTMEILTALRLSGYQHRLLGRPLPGDPVAPLEEIVPRVLARLRANPWAAGVAIDEARVRALAERHYTGIAPWPFEALLSDRLG